MDVPALQSQLPSLGPVTHLSCHLEQSNTGFPSFRFTSLCAPHNHQPNSSLLPTRGASRAMYPWKSSAHTQQGYSREKSFTKLTRSFCWGPVGFSGYVAAMLWRSVHEERPRASTSGGHSTFGFVVVCDLLVAALKVLMIDWFFDDVA
jgi:hypothetical protein